MTAASPTEEAFQRGLMDAALPVPDGLTDGMGRPAGQRYAVYRNNIAVSLRDALETGFPAVAKLIGPENFSRAAGIYLRSQPPTTPLMMHYGASFPAFLEGIDALRPIGYLGDVARLDYAMRLSYHAADAPVFDAARLTGVSEDKLMQARFVLAPATQVLRSNWPVYAIYRFTLTPGSPKPEATAQDVVITRPGFDPVPHLLPADGGAFLEALHAGQSFGDALNDAPDDFDLSATLTLLLQQGAFTDLILA